MAECANNDSWAIRWDELDKTLPRQTPTSDELEEAKLDLLKDVTFTDANEAEEASLDALVEQSADILEDPEALRDYAGARVRHAHIRNILASEGLTPPALQSFDS